MPDPKRGARPAAGRSRGDGYRRYAPKRKVCAFCADKNLQIDYKDPSKLRRFLSDRAKIEPRRKTGTCARHQRKLTTAIKRSRHLAMLPFTSEHIRWSGGVGVRSAEERRPRRDMRPGFGPPPPGMGGPGMGGPGMGAPGAGGMAPGAPMAPEAAQAGAPPSLENVQAAETPVAIAAPAAAEAPVTPVEPTEA